MSIVPWSTTSTCGGSTTSPTTLSSAATLLARVVALDAAIAHDLLTRYGSLGALRGIDRRTLSTDHGLTQRQVARLRDVLDLGLSLLVEPQRERPQIVNSRDAARLVLPEMGSLEQEQMRLLLLNTKHRLITTFMLYVGTVSACQVRVAELFREAVRCNATALIVVHNHPSGEAEPSPEDVSITRQIVQAGRLLDLEVLDHLVIGHNTYTSLRERGLGWE